MKNMIVVDHVEDAIYNLENAMTIYGELFEDCFAMEKPDVMKYQVEYHRLTVFMNILGDLIWDALEKMKGDKE